MSPPNYYAAQMNLVLRIAFFGIFLVGLAEASLRAQTQTTFNRLDDFTGSVQTFITEQTGLLTGVSLVLFGHGVANDITVYLRALRPDGSLAPDLLATGFVPASAVSTTTAEWRFIPFDAPVSISAGDSYGLVLNQFGSGPTGYVDFGSSTGNPYANGRMMFESFPGQPLNPIFPDLDLAFQNAVAVPEPGVLALLVLGSLGVFGLRGSNRRTVRTANGHILDVLPAH